MTKTHKKFPQYLEDQRQFFNELVTVDWGEGYEDQGWMRIIRLEVEDVFSRIRPAAILNVGCGSGFHDVAMARQPHVNHVLGIDYSEQSIETANRVNPHPKVKRIVGDIFALDEGRRFDAAISFQVIEHVPNAAAFLDACRRQVVPGGWVVVLTPNRQRLNNRLRTLLGMKLSLEDPQHFCEYTTEDLARMGSQMDLKFEGEMSYGLSLSVPRAGWEFVPPGISYHLGKVLPRIANRFGIFLRVLA